MKKIVLLATVIFSFGLLANAQTINKKEALKISEEVNAQLESMDKALTKTDWKQVQKSIDKTATILEKNADNVSTILENIDFTKLLLTVAKLQSAIEQNADVEGMEKSMEKISERLSITMKKIMAETK